MNPLDWQNLTTVAYIILGVFTVAFVLALILTVWVLVKIQRINLPPNADVITTLRATPLVVVIVLDLLDLGLDVFSAPITWILLTRLGLAPLRWIAVIKDLIPFDDVIPAMTIAWLIARVTGPRQIALVQQIGPPPPMIEAPRRSTRR